MQKVTGKLEVVTDEVKVMKEKILSIGTKFDLYVKKEEFEKSIKDLLPNGPCQSTDTNLPCRGFSLMQDVKDQVQSYNDMIDDTKKFIESETKRQEAYFNAKQDFEKKLDEKFNSHFKVLDEKNIDENEDYDKKNDNNKNKEIKDADSIVSHGPSSVTSFNKKKRKKRESINNFSSLTEKRINISGGSSYEPIVGYSRAVLVGNILHISGTTASSTGGPLLPDAGLQTKEILSIIRKVLEENGSCIEDVVRTRMFVVDIGTNGKAVGEAHGYIFSDIRPASSMIGVAGLIDVKMLVEIECEAIIGCGK